jgi:hypothetical protein
LLATQAQTQTKAHKRASTLSSLTKIELEKSPPLLKIKKYAPLNRHSMTEQLNNDNGLQARWTKGLLITTKASLGAKHRQ